MFRYLGILLFAVVGLSPISASQTETIERPYPRFNNILIEEITATDTGNGTFSVDIDVYSGHYSYLALYVGASEVQDGSRVLIGRNPISGFISPSNTRAFFDSIFPPVEGILRWLEDARGIIEESRRGLDADFRYIRSPTDVVTEFRGLEMSCANNSLYIAGDIGDVELMNVLDLFISGTGMALSANELFSGNNPLISDLGADNVVDADLTSDEFIRRVGLNIVRDTRFTSRATPFVQKGDFNGLFRSYLLTDDFLRQVFLPATLKALANPNTSLTSQDEDTLTRVFGGLLSADEGLTTAEYTAITLDVVIDTTFEKVSEKFPLLQVLVVAGNVIPAAIDLVAQSYSASQQYPSFFIPLKFASCSNSRDIHVDHIEPLALNPGVEQTVSFVGGGLTDVTDVDSSDCPRIGAVSAVDDRLIEIRCRVSSSVDEVTFTITDINLNAFDRKVRVNRDQVLVTEQSLETTYQIDELFNVAVIGSGLINATAVVTGCSNQFISGQRDSFIQLRCDGIPAAGFYTLDIFDSAGVRIKSTVFEVVSTATPEVFEYQFPLLKYGVVAKFDVFGENFVVNSSAQVSARAFGCEENESGLAPEFVSANQLSFNCTPATNSDSISVEITTTPALGNRLISTASEPVADASPSLRIEPQTLPDARIGREYSAYLTVIGGTKPYKVSANYPTSAFSVRCDNQDENCAAVGQFYPSISFDGNEAVMLSGEVCNGQPDGALDISVTDDDGVSASGSWSFSVDTQANHPCTLKQDGGRYEVFKPTLDGSQLRFSNRPLARFGNEVVSAATSDLGVVVLRYDTVIGSEKISIVTSEKPDGVWIAQSGSVYYLVTEEPYPGIANGRLIKTYFSGDLVNWSVGQQFALERPFAGSIPRVFTVLGNENDVAVVARDSFDDTTSVHWLSGRSTQRYDGRRIGIQPALRGDTLIVLESYWEFFRTEYLKMIEFAPNGINEIDIVSSRSAGSSTNLVVPFAGLIGDNYRYIIGRRNSRVFGQNGSFGESQTCAETADAGGTTQLATSIETAPIFSAISTDASGDFTRFLNSWTETAGCRISADLHYRLPNDPLLPSSNPPVADHSIILDDTIWTSHQTRPQDGAPRVSTLYGVRLDGSGTLKVKLDSSFSQN